MVKRNMFLGMLVLVLTFGLALGGCSNSTSGNDVMTTLIIAEAINAANSGRLTVTNIPAEFDGRAVSVMGMASNGTGPGNMPAQAGEWAVSLGSYFTSQDLTPAQQLEQLPVVSNQSATAQLAYTSATYEQIQAGTASNVPQQYRGDHTFSTLIITLINKETTMPVAARTFTSVTFANGNATLDWNNGTGGM